MNFLFGKPPVYSKNSKLEVIDIKKIISTIKFDKNLKAITAETRALKDNLARKKAKAKNLPYIMGFEYSKLIRNSANFKSADVFIFEADHVENIEKKIAEICKNEFILLLYRSVSGDGFKFIVKLNQPISGEYHYRVYNFFKLYFNKQFNIELDPSSNDMARVQYLSHDKDIFVNLKSKPIIIDEVIKSLKAIDELPTTQGNYKEELEYTTADIEKIIDKVRAKGFLEEKNEQTWWEMSMCFASLGEDGREYFLRLSLDHPLYPEDTEKKLNKRFDKMIESWGNYHDESRYLNMNAFFNIVEKNYKIKPPKQKKDLTKSLEFILADKFVEKYKNSVLYDHSKSGKARTYGWYIWNENRFELAKKGEISNYYLEFLKEEKKEALELAKRKDEEKKNLGEGIAPTTLPGDENILTLAQVFKAETRRLRDLTLTWVGERDGLGVLPDELDQDPELFNTLNGVFNLKTNEILDHDPEFKLTKLATVSHQPKSKCHKWEHFINKISFDNENIARYIQEAVGYSLTGHTSEQCLFFLYGIGANGKSTFLEGLKLIFGDYQIHANYETFTNMSRDGNSHSEDVVRLKGSRLVISSEINANKSLNESVIKQITSGDTITARDLHSSSIEFKPTFKLWIAGNHKPKIQNFDHGIKRRIMIIPFEYTFTPEEIRPQYEIIEEFKQERAGILNWALEGAKRWFDNKKLIVPEEIKETTQQYFLENNVIEQFLHENCDKSEKGNPLTATYSVNAKTLYKEYLRFVEISNDEKLGRNQFYSRLEELGFKRDVNSSQQTIFRGLQLKEDTEKESVNKAINHNRNNDLP